MTYQEILAAARTCSGPYCKACPVCNGRACKNTMPGPGAKGTGTLAARNYDAWQEVCLNMDTICENGPVDTRFTLFGQTYDLPVFAGPVGADRRVHREPAFLKGGCGVPALAQYLYRNLFGISEYLFVPWGPLCLPGRDDHVSQRASHHGDCAAD